MRVGWCIVVLLIGCRSKPHDEVVATGSGSGSAIAAVVAADAAIDAAAIARRIDQTCDVRPPASVHCEVTPRDGVLAANTCWRVLVAVIPADAKARVDVRTSDPAC